MHRVHVVYDYEDIFHSVQCMYECRCQFNVIRQRSIRLFYRHLVQHMHCLPQLAQIINNVHLN